MKEYILREDVLNKAIDPIESYITDEVVCVEDIKSIPAADVKEVVYGKWVWYSFSNGWDAAYRCTACDETTLGNYHKFCPKCGAKMDLK